MLRYPDRIIRRSVHHADRSAAGQPGIVHHVPIFEDTSGVPAQLDAADPGPGYTNFGGTDLRVPTSIGVGTWTGMMSQPNGMGILLPETPTSFSRSTIPVVPLGRPIPPEVRFPAEPRSTATGVYIARPCRTSTSTMVRSTFPLILSARILITSYQRCFWPSPLARTRTRSDADIRSFGVTPSNDTIPFIDIPEWISIGRTSTPFPRVLHLPTGTTLYSEVLR